MSADKLLTPDQLAERWQVPKSHIYRLTREGWLGQPEDGVWMPLGRYYRYRLEGVKEFERSGGCGGARS